MSMELLNEKDCWVCMQFADGSVRSIHTTLNKNVLDEHGAAPRNEHFFDLDHNVYVPFRRDAVDIVVRSEKPAFDQEVLQFASRFI